VRARLPGIAVLLASGYAARAVAEGEAGRQETVLRKPYGAPALLAAVAAALDRSATPIAA
jgi:hypothetical protein